MHRALEIQEILSEIFRYFVPAAGLDPVLLVLRARPDPVLAALARTCRAFKEPAVDALWRVLADLSPLSQCLPGIVLPEPSRPLTKADWHTLRNNTRRIRCIYNFHSDLPLFQLLPNPPATEPLFPSLRYLYCRYDELRMPWLNLPLPSLIHLKVVFDTPKLLHDSLNAFPKFSPNIKNLRIYLENRSDSVTIEPNYICHWQNLCSVQVNGVNLDMNDLVHLSRMPALTHLECTLKPTLPCPNSFLTFSNLVELVIHLESLDSVSRLLRQSRLPIIMHFEAHVRSRHFTSREKLASFLTGLLASNPGNTIMELVMYHRSTWVRSEAALIDVDDLRPCVAFVHLRRLKIDLECDVHLTDSDLLALASAWPELEYLDINSGWGWNTACGITPGGLIQLWETCRSLTDISLRLDTRGYTQVPPSEALDSLRPRLTLPPHIILNVLDSAIEAASVSAIATFLCGIIACCTSPLWLCYWHMSPIDDGLNAAVEAYRERWDEVQARAYGPRVY